MKFIYIVALSLIAPVFMISLAEADSVSLSTDTITYEGYKLSGQSFSVNTDLNKNYGYQLSMQRVDAFTITERQGSLTISNKIDVTNLSLGIYRTFWFDKFYLRPIIGAVHSTANVKTTIRYQKDYRLGDYSYPVDLKLTVRQSKTAILPMYGASIGYLFTDNVGVFAGVKDQGYKLNSVGVIIRF